MFPYVEERFNEEEEAILQRYFTNVYGPVFALVNLPEVVKGALFARYSRASKSLRRLFLDEFVVDLEISGDASVDATVGLKRAEELYERVFFEYGDDSVAQLGGVHLACEQASNILTKILEWGRLMSYLEQSTRYIGYDDRLPSGHYRYHRPPSVLESHLGARYVGDMDRMFDTYGELLPRLQSWLIARFPRQPGDSDFVHRQAIRAKALDGLRGLLPAAALSNVGIYGTGQSYELVAVADALAPAARGALLRRAHADRAAQGDPVVPPARRPARARRGVVGVLRQHPQRDGAGAGAPLARRHHRAPGRGGGQARGAAGRLRPRRRGQADRGHRVQPDARSARPSSCAGCASSASTTGSRSCTPTWGTARTAATGRAGPSSGRTTASRSWSTTAPSGTSSATGCSPSSGSRSAPRSATACPTWWSRRARRRPSSQSLERSRQLYEAMVDDFPVQAGYAVALAYRVRCVMQMNAREAMHLIELRSGTQGHPAYRRIAQQMYKAIAEQAGHKAIAAAMIHVDHGWSDLERLEGERRAETRRARRGGGKSKSS